MAIQLKRTKEATAQAVKLLVYGQAGAGKTSLIPTLPKPVILSAEGGLLSIADTNLPFIEITSMDDLREAYKWLTSSTDAAEFESVALDSINFVRVEVLTGKVEIDGFSAVAVPEPSTWALVGIGLGALVVIRRQR